jgi:NurA domain
MGYGQIKGRKPFERASKIAHAEILNNPDVQEFVDGCTLPSAPDGSQIEELQKPLPFSCKRVAHVIAVDGGMTEVAVRREFPSASMAFMTFGPLTLALSDLTELDFQPFIAPEDMAKLKNLQRYSLPLPAKSIRAAGAHSFSQGVRRQIQRFMAEKHPELIRTLQWLLFREWLVEVNRKDWEVPQCPMCHDTTIRFESGGPIELACKACGAPVYLSDALRLYERIDDEQGAGGVMSYLLTTLELLIIVRIIRELLDLKPSILREILLIKDGPLAFFGVVAPLHKPARELMAYLSDLDNGKPLICLIGLEKSGAFVEHANLIEPSLKNGHYLLPDTEYIYKYIQPGAPSPEGFGHNTYFGAKLIFKSDRGDVFVATVPTQSFKAAPTFDDLLNGAEVLRVTSELRCSMYDNALIPVVLVNRLVSLADVPSSEILKRFVKASVTDG